MNTARRAAPEVPGLAARRIAADILDNVLRRRRPLDLELEDAAHPGFATLADRDRVTLNRRVSKDKVVRVVFSVAAMTEGKINDVPLQAGDTIYVEERVF